MHLTFAPRGILQIDNARITYKNFSGVGDKFNREGDRNFALIIDDQEIADALINDKNKYGVGWNVKIKPPREEGDEPFMYLPVKVKFSDYGPNVYLKSGDRVNKLDARSIGSLDKIRISNIDLDIRPYDDVVNGKPFRSAYLQSMDVIQDVVDRFADRHSDRFDTVSTSPVDDDDLPFDI
jgi:hypothetical protein